MEGSHGLQKNESHLSLMIMGFKTTRQDHDEIMWKETSNNTNLKQGDESMKLATMLKISKMNITLPPAFTKKCKQRSAT
jgi:hypothetical protein